MPASQRRVAEVIEPEPVVEGAGVRLKRSIGTRTLNYLDPFLLLDHFASNDSGRLRGRLSATSPSRNRDGHLHASGAASIIAIASAIQEASDRATFNG